MKTSFPKKIFLPQAEKNRCYRRASLFSDLNAPAKMIKCYIRDANTFLGYHTLFIEDTKTIKGIELTRFAVFEVLGLPHL